MLRTIVLAVLLGGAGALFAATPGGANGNKQIVTDTIDQGGQAITSGLNKFDNSIGGIVGASSGGNFTMLHGYIAQLSNPIGPDSISTIMAAPNPANVNQAVTFTVVADADLTISYNFGDGSTDTSNQATVQHAYTTAGLYTATATVSNGDGEFVSKSVDVMVFNAGAFDSDGDGVSNAIEDLLGGPNDKFNFNATPLGVTPGQMQPLTLTRLQVTLNFAVANVDQISLQGKVPVPVGFNPTNQVVAIDAGGVAQKFTLDLKGQQKVGTSAFKVTLRLKNGVTVIPQTATFSWKTTFGNFKTQFADDGLTNTTIRNAVRMIPVNLVFNSGAYQTLKPLKYSCTLNKTGKAR